MARAIGVLLGAWFACCLDPRPGVAQTVVFDQGHRQQFLIEGAGSLDLSGFAEILRKAGLEVTARDGQIDDAGLANAGGLVISGAFAPLATAESDSILRFLQSGGRLCVMLHIGPPVADLLHRLGVSITNGVILERENLIKEDPTSFFVEDLTPHDLTRGLDRFALFGAWGLLNTGDDAQILARTSPRAWVDLNGDRVLGDRDAVQAFGVLVTGTFGSGRFVVFGDDAVFQNQFLKGENASLARNLAHWLSGAQKVRTPLREEAAQRSI